MGNSIKVLGLDLAAAHSGVCLIEARPISGRPPIEVNVIKHCPIEIDQNADFLVRANAVLELLDIAAEADLVVIEDYVRSMGNNTTAYEHAELSGLAKYLIYSVLKKPIIIMPPTTMRSFVKIPPKQKDKGKGYIMKRMEEIYGFKADAPRKPQRSNMTDAFVHSILGALLFFAKTDQLIGDLESHEKRIIYGSGKFVGLTERTNLLYDPTGELYGEES